jgi:hypothetical protein
VTDRPMDLLPKRIEQCELAQCRGCKAVRPDPPTHPIDREHCLCMHCQDCFDVLDWRKEYKSENHLSLASPRTKP